MNILKTPLAAVFSLCVCGGGDMYENGFSSLNVRNASFRHVNASQVRACVPVLFVWLKGTFCPNSSFSNRPAAEWCVYGASVQTWCVENEEDKSAFSP